MNDYDIEVSHLKGIGAKSAEWLRDGGIHTRGDLESVGVVNAYLIVRQRGVNPSLNLLWALQGALTGTHWTHIPEDLKQALRDQLKAAEQDFKEE